MISALFRQEMVMAARRQRTYLLRGVYTVFLIGLAYPLVAQLADLSTWLPQQDGVTLLGNFLRHHFMLVLLLTPAFVAGAITQEKDRGTLPDLLTCPITSLELLLAKLFARLLQLGLILFLGLPLFCFLASLLEDALLPVAILAASLGLALGLGSLALLASVWCRNTRDALLLCYALLTAALVCWTWAPAMWWPTWLAEGLDPIGALGLNDRYSRWEALGRFLLFWLGVTVVGLGVASWRLRGAYRRQLQKAHPTRGDLRRKALRVRGNPVLWRERHFERLVPLGFLRIVPRWFGVLAFAGVSAAILGFLLFLAVRSQMPAAMAQALLQSGDWASLRDAVLASDRADTVFIVHGLAALTFLSALAVMRASGSITSEKERGTWGSLLITPLTTRKILHGKRRAVLRACVPLLAAHAVVALPLGLCVRFSCFTWALVLSAVAPFAVLLASSLGLWASAGSRSSWRSFLKAGSLFYLGWMGFGMLLSCMLLLIRGLLAMVLAVLGLFQNNAAAQEAVQSWEVQWLALAGGLLLAYRYLNARLLHSAEDHIGRSDRTLEFDAPYHFLFRDIERKQREADTRAISGDWAEPASPPQKAGNMSG